MNDFGRGVEQASEIYSEDSEVMREYVLEKDKLSELARILYQNLSELYWLVGNGEIRQYHEDYYEEILDLTAKKLQELGVEVKR